MSDNAYKFQSKVVLDGVSIGESNHFQEPQDDYNRQVAFRRFKKTLSSGTHTINLYYGDYNGGTAYIWDASISVTKISIQ